MLPTTIDTSFRRAALTPPLVAFIASSALRRNPYWLYRLLRRIDPVHRSPLGLTILSRHADVAAVLRHPDMSSDEANADDRALRMTLLTKALGRAETRPDDGPFNRVFSDVMLFRDAPDHTRLRALVSKAFTARRIAAIADRVQDIVDEMLDVIAAKGETDLMSDFAYPLPALVICELLGVPRRDAERIVAWARPLAIGLDPSPMRSVESVVAADIATRELAAYLDQLIAERRKNPAGDLLSVLIEAEEAGDRLSHDELIATFVLLLVAGHETTANLIGNAVVALLDSPHQLQRLREDPTLDASAVEEFLRYDSPVQMLQRVTLAEVTIGETVVPARRIVVLMLGAANRDPDVFTDPDRLDVGRHPNPHLAFGGGAHFCVGAALARTEARIAIGTLVRRFGDLRRSDVPTRRPSFTIRGMSELPLAVR